MSDSGSESSSSEGYNNESKSQHDLENLESPRSQPLSPESSRKSPAASSVSSRAKSPPDSTPASPESQRSDQSPTNRRENFPYTSRSPQSSISKSSQKSFCSVVSPRSERSSSRSPTIHETRSHISSPDDSKSQTFCNESKPYESADTRRSIDQSPKSYKSEGSPQFDDGHSSIKSPRSILSTRSSQKSSEDEHESPLSPLAKDRRTPAYNDLDGEQISDGDIEDEPAINSKQSEPSIPQMTHGEDLSDVSDLESNDDIDTNNQDKDTEEKNRSINQELNGRDERNDDKSQQKKDDEKVVKEDKITVPVCITEESEQLDFEAEGQWKDERDEGEMELVIKDNKDIGERDSKDKDKEDDGKDKNKIGGSNDKEEGEEDGEKVESELEEGELSDGDDARPEETEPRPVCRFYNRGQCTWGVSCRFLHPGVTDKGNYTMFDMVRPMAYPPHVPPPHEFRPHIERSTMMRPISAYGPPIHPPKVEEASTESAWERGLRHAKEMMRKANKRKESDMDFEEKKMNLSLGQEELDREAGYYMRPASPEQPAERWPPSREISRRIPAPRMTPDRFVEEPDTYYPPPSAPSDYYRRVHYKADTRSTNDYRERVDYHQIPRPVAPHSVSPQPPRERERDREREREREREYYEKYEKKHKRPSREVIVERIPPTKPWREEEPAPVERGRGDEWADPWMRRKSPTSVRRNTSSRRSRRQSYSSGSSYSSTSSSRSSSRSSYSSYDSLSRSRSPSPPARTRGSHKGKLNVAPSPTNTPTTIPPAPRGAMLMNPPAPSPRPPKGSLSPTTGTIHRRAGLNPPAPSPLSSHRSHHEKTRDKAALAAAAVAKVIKSRSRSRSSHSSSGSESSGSSSDSSESSYSSSSSEVRKRKGLSPIQTRKDAKGMDALKLGGTKQQIKLTLKPTSNTPSVKKVDRSAIVVGKKRPLVESPPSIDSKASVAAAAAKAAKKASSRREELLKQLKAVEDAIARKRSKV